MIRKSYFPEQIAEALPNLFAQIFGCRRVPNRKLQPVPYIAGEVRPEFIEHLDALKLLANHPFAAQHLVGIEAVGSAEIHDFHGCAIGFETSHRRAADVVDLLVHAETGNVRRICDPQALRILRALHDVERALPRAAPPRSARADQVPIMPSSINAASSALRASGPCTWPPSQGSRMPRLGISPPVVRTPTMPQNAAGIRIEQPKSVPCASGTMPARDRDRRTAGRSGRAQRGIPRIEGRAEQRIDGVGAGREFRRIGLAEDDRAGLAQPLDRGGVLVRYEILVERRTEGGADALGERHVLDDHRQAMQRTACSVATCWPSSPPRAPDLRPRSRSH